MLERESRNPRHRIGAGRRSPRWPTDIRNGRDCLRAVPKDETFGRERGLVEKLYVVRAIA